MQNGKTVYFCLHSHKTYSWFAKWAWRIPVPKKLNVVILPVTPVKYWWQPSGGLEKLFITSKTN